MSFVPDDYTPGTDELSGKTLLVTGAGDGIGRAAALAYARHGAEVLLLGRTEKKLEAVYDAIISEGLREPGIIPLDLATANEDQYRELAQQLSGTFDKLDGLLHNAGLLGDRRSMAQTSLQLWHQVMQANVNATQMLTQVLFPLLEQAPSASVVMTSSGVGRKGRAFWGAYAVSKFAVEGMMQVWADEMGDTSRIRFNSLNPGAVNTAMRRTAYPAEPPTNNPDPETLMRGWIYLMSDASAAVNGQALSAQ
ncbi:short chain dehydrogenase [Luminiphilus syltensis NOR5-1B]|uniref:Short chain dehydrogenase n=1 Tax=Luminiphilus syltensis NOR5-1B TaxID=565045 RepID=B8KQJ6_9GAMM|nr:YciK family oxidoreductase [Luminiphilus syltensis]EED34452.1 short chain dehydrogenase [Luminiphilus syltensis NOR5-1B]